MEGFSVLRLARSMVLWPRGRYESDIHHCCGKEILTRIQYIFLIYGSVTMAVGILVCFTLPNDPEHAWFFSKEEKDLARVRVSENRIATREKVCTAHKTLTECIMTRYCSDGSSHRSEKPFLIQSIGVWQSSSSHSQSRMPALQTYGLEDRVRAGEGY